MTDYAEGFKDYVAWKEGMTVSDLPVSHDEACWVLNTVLSMASFTGGFSAVGDGKTEIYFSVQLPDMLTTETGAKELLLKLNLDELDHTAELATGRILKECV